MVAKRLVAAALLLAFPMSLHAQSVPPEMAAPPRVLLASNAGAVDDSDLQTEETDETLEKLNKIEFDKDAWSTGAAVGLSAIPGGGFGLIYAQKKAAAVVPFLVSAAGYTVGALYMAGFFNTKKKTVCLYDTGTVDKVHCLYALHGNPDPIKTDNIDNHTIDPNTVVQDNPATPQNEAFAGHPYYEADSNSHYTETFRGDTFNGKKTGIYIIAGTYVATTLLGAVWSGLTVADHNEELRKNIESTAQTKPMPQPMVGFDGETGFMGMTWGF